MSEESTLCTSGFIDLGHARMVRDDLERFLADDLKAILEPARAAKVQDMIMCAHRGWKQRLEMLAESMADRWDGNGAPPWSYLRRMRDAIAYIVEAERHELAELRNSHGSSAAQGEHSAECSKIPTGGCAS